MPSSGKTSISARYQSAAVCSQSRWDVRRRFRPTRKSRWTDRDRDRRPTENKTSSDTDPMFRTGRDKSVSLFKEMFESFRKCKNPDIIFLKFQPFQKEAKNIDPLTLISLSFACLLRAQSSSEALDYKLQNLFFLKRLSLFLPYKDQIHWWSPWWGANHGPLV